jgi:SAM-dependent methyltransferase
VTERAYVFERSAAEPELERLHALEAAFDPATQRWLLTTGLAAGWRCIEAGAGAGSMVRWLAGRVGPSGHVQAIDIDTRFLRRLELPNVDIVAEDLCAPSPPMPSAELVHARFVLIHLQSWEKAFAALVDRLRPGGWLVLEEPDFTLARAYAGDEVHGRAYARVQRAIRAMFESRGLDPGFGARLPALLGRAGLEAIAVEHDAPIVAGSTAAARIMQLSAAQLRAHYLATGCVDEADLARYHAYCSDPRGWALHHGTVRVRGRVPC